MFNVGDIIIGKVDAIELSDKNLIAKVVSENPPYIIRASVIYTDTSKSCLRPGDEVYVNEKNYELFSTSYLYSSKRHFVENVDVIWMKIKEANRKISDSIICNFKLGDEKIEIDNSEKSVNILFKKGEFKMHTKLTKQIPAISKYIQNGKAVVVFFADGTKESVVCTEGDTFDLEIGIEKCILKKVCGQNVKNQIKFVIREQEKRQKQKEDFEKQAKELKALVEAKKKKEYERRMKMRARYEARYKALVEEELQSLKKSKKVISE